MNKYNDLILKRVSSLQAEIFSKRYSHQRSLKVEFAPTKKETPFKEIRNLDFQPIECGQKWGDLWSSAWFSFSAQIPSSFQGEEVVALIELGGEGCVFKDGEPYMGLTYKQIGQDHIEVKRRIPLYTKAKGGENVKLLVEGAANTLFGDPDFSSHPNYPFYTLNQAEIAIFHREFWDLGLDIDFLINLYRSLDEKTPRAKRILSGLNEVANLYQGGKGVLKGLAITKKLLNSPSHRSDMTVWSIGHAHLDLAWHWPYRETKRKAGRTFSTALKLIEEYPDYIFGASQPQLFQWVKDKYPNLFKRVQKAVKQGRFELQGAMWVEPDMNLISGESLVRQCYYGKTFYKEEFDVEVKNLWLPDVFGYSAALPQILKGCGVDSFVTQKISWNEINTFPYHTFNWVGIDGTSILSHFLPTNDYSLRNLPQQLIDSQNRFSESDIEDGFLNMFGIGDGGGGPSRKHIEFAKRGADCEGLPRVKMAKAQDFLDSIAVNIPKKRPEWRGELYLELHRGTYTNQARIKKYNRTLELLLRNLEFLSSFVSDYPKEQIDSIWKNVLLNQFHDVLPGSSIKEVYEDAHQISEEALGEVEKLTKVALNKFFPIRDNSVVTLINTLSWPRIEKVSLKTSKRFSPSKRVLSQVQEGETLKAIVDMPAMGYISLSLEDCEFNDSDQILENQTYLENDLVCIHLDEQGCICSYYDKEVDREILDERANVLLLFEDKPYYWDAWDIASYYKEMEPEQAKLISRSLLKKDKLETVMEQVFSVGISTIRQKLTLKSYSKQISIECFVDWKETQKLLKVQAKPALSAQDATFEIQYGSLKRPTTANNSWEQAQFEVCAHRYADLSEPNYGFAILNDCKYGYGIKGNTMELSLLRSSILPDKNSDKGKHHFSYAYLPHLGDHIKGEVHQRAHEFNQGVISVIGQKNQLDKSSYLRATEGVEIDCVKNAFDNQGVVIRLYETRGERVTTSLTGDFLKEKRIQECDLLENPLRNMFLNPEKLHFTPFQIRTFRLLPSGE